VAAGDRSEDRLVPDEPESCTRARATSRRAGPSSNIYSIRPDGTGLRQLTHDADGTTNNGVDSSSPDGTKLVYVSNRAGASYTLWTMNADGSHPTRLTKTEGHFADWGTHP
jgi:Tol biopolymer transport system component